VRSFPRRIEQTQILSIFLQNGFRFRKISDFRKRRPGLRDGSSPS